MVALVSACNLSSMASTLCCNSRGDENNEKILDLGIFSIRFLGKCFRITENELTG